MQRSVDRYKHFISCTKSPKYFCVMIRNVGKGGAFYNGFILLCRNVNGNGDLHFMNIVTHLVKRGILACGWKCVTLHNFNAGREKKFVL